MKEYGILMTLENIRLILDRKKTQTRRVIEKIDKYKNVKPGDMLYIQETWGSDWENKPWYKLDYDNRRKESGYTPKRKKDPCWKSSMFMPKSAARYWLRVTKDTWVEHIQDISVEDCIKEGIDMESEYANLLINQLNSSYDCEVKHKDIGIMIFEKLWDKINAKRNYNFGSNPRVRVLEFEYIKEK